MSSDRILSLSS